MNKQIILIISMLLLCKISISQNNDQFEVVPLAENQKFTLNSQSRIGGTTRTTIPINLPVNTVSWIYMLSTKKNGAPESLNLLTQVSSLFDRTAGIQTRIVNSIVNSLVYPTGEASINAYLINQEEYSNFINKNSFSYFAPASRLAFTSGPAKVDYPYLTGQYYIGLENPAAVSGVSLILDAVAIVKKQRSPLYQKKSIQNHNNFNQTEIIGNNQTTLILKNNTPNELFTSYVQRDFKKKCWVSRGWYKIGAYESTEIELGDYEGIVYTNAHQFGKEYTTWGNEKSFCVNPRDAFEIYYAAKPNCEKTAMFNLVRVYHGVNTYTFNP